MAYTNPYLALSFFLIAVLVIALFVWPKKGLISHYRRWVSSNKKILIEDALKHIFDYESHNLVPTLNSVAGNLGITADRSSKIVENLKKLNLVTFNDHALSLTKNGREYALRIIRIHRLWENYLAEETGINETDWHDEAEKVEHLMTQKEADILSAKMGNPKFDPHGDPIPTTDGKIVSGQGQLLNTIPPGETVKITHIEDEPKLIYKRLLDEGLYPGKEMQVVETGSEKIRIAIDGREKRLNLLDASKLTVEILEGKIYENKKIKTLADIQIGETAEVINISPNCRGHQRRRLLDFGIVPGSKISIHIRNPLNDPRAYLVKDTIVALRNNQADKIVVKT